MNVAPFPPQTTAGLALRGQAELTAAREIAGYAFDASAPDKRLVVELWLDGQPVRLARADIFDPDLRAKGIGDGAFGFVFSLDDDLLESAETAEVRLANSGEPVGQPVTLAEAGAPPRFEGEARWAGGLRICGWVPKGAEGPIRAYVEGVEVAAAHPQYFAHVGVATDGGLARGFELSLPRAFADGRLRRARVVDGEDRELPGSPCPVLAFPRTLERFLEDHADVGGEKVRAGLFDRLLPQSAPWTQFAEWTQAFPPARAVNVAPTRVAVAIIGGPGAEATIASLDGQTDGVAVAAPIRAGPAPMTYVADDLTAFLDIDAGASPIVVFAPAGARFHPHALGRFAEAFARKPEATLVYCDLALSDADGREWPLAHPAFDYERMLEQGYAAFCFGARLAHVRKALGQGVDDLFRLFNFALDEAGPSGSQPPIHAPGFLVRLPALDLSAASEKLALATRAHLEARKLNFTVDPRAGRLLPAVRVRRAAPAGKVSILIPIRDRVELLRRCLASLDATLGEQLREIVVIDNDSASAETLNYLDEIERAGVRVARASGPFNFARLINAGASIADGEFLLWLNNDIEALREGWLEEMLSRLAEPDVGAVGAKLLHPSGVVQHGGVVLGPNLAAAHALDERYDGDPGYGDLLHVAHETSAVTGACLLTPRRLFRDMGGLDSARFPILFNDVDYCLRLRASGRRVVFTPHLRLVHSASSSRGADGAFAGRHRHQRDLDQFRMAWAEVLSEDPFYNPMLGLDTPYAGLAWPPRSQSPRTPRIERPTSAPLGF